MSHSNPRQINVAGSMTNWPAVTACVARAVGVTTASASTTRIVFIERSSGTAVKTFGARGSNAKAPASDRWRHSTIGVWRLRGRSLIHLRRRSDVQEVARQLMSYPIRQMDQARD